MSWAGKGWPAIFSKNSSSFLASALDRRLLIQQQHNRASSATATTPTAENVPATAPVFWKKLHWEDQKSEVVYEHCCNHLLAAPTFAVGVALARFGTMTVVDEGIARDGWTIVVRGAVIASVVDGVVIDAELIGGVELQPIVKNL